jgi:hypothetical protein
MSWATKPDLAPIPFTLLCGGVESGVSGTPQRVADTPREPTAAPLRKVVSRSAPRWCISTYHLDLGVGYAGALDRLWVHDPGVGRAWLHPQHTAGCTQVRWRRLVHPVAVCGCRSVRGRPRMHPQCGLDGHADGAARTGYRSGVWEGPLQVGFTPRRHAAAASQEVVPGLVPPRYQTGDHFRVVLAVWWPWGASRPLLV